MVSIKDVAQLAGVAVGTVSRVINNAGAVKPSTRDKVEAAIKALNYVPDEVARNFKMQRSRTVALMLPSIWHPFYSEMAFYIEDELDRKDFKLMLCNSGGRPEKELHYLDMLKQNKVAGIVAITYNEIENGVTAGIPMVSIDRHFNKRITCVTSDNFEGGRLALRELIKSGAKHPAFLGDVPSMYSETMRRKDGFVHEAQALGVPCTVYEEPAPLRDEDAYYSTFLREHPDIDGVFAVNDMTAAKYIEKAGQAGIRVPGDVKVIGYDGIQNHPYFHPLLSTIRQPVEEMARTAVRLLLGMVEGEAPDREIYLHPVQYRAGETT